MDTLPFCGRAARKVRVLIVNVVMRARTGTEVVVRELALGLARRGHQVAVYAPLIGTSGRELRAHGIDVVDNVRRLTAPPDIIHGHHNRPTLHALDHFPDCPAIWMCHDWRAWWDRPPILARIHRYVAVDRTRRDYLVNDAGADAKRVLVLPNAVDLARTPPRAAPLPRSPGRALIYATTNGQLPVLLEACRRAGLACASLGRGVGREIANPEHALVHYDLVFATGRSAIDALAAGCAVIVADARGYAGLVTTQTYEHLREHNFAVHAPARSLDVDAVVAEIGRYDADDARRICERIRRDADIEPWLDMLEHLYAEAIDCAAVARGARDDDDALRRYVKQIYPRLRWHAFRHKQWMRGALSRFMTARPAS